MVNKHICTHTYIYVICLFVYFYTIGNVNKQHLNTLIEILDHFFEKYNDCFLSSVVWEVVDKISNVYMFYNNTLFLFLQFIMIK